MDETSNHIGDIIEAELQYLRGEGPPVDLSGFDEKTQAEAVGIIKVIEALAGSLPASPPLERDPVAIRLGLVDGPIRDPRCRPIQD